MEKIKVVVTGANGYVGAHVLSHFKKNHFDVHQMGRQAVDSSVPLIPFSLGENNAYAALRGKDVLIHCAYDFSLRASADIERVNFLGSMALFQAAHEQGIKKIILISTTSAFAQAESHYGQVKYKLEQAAKKYHAMVVRPGLIFSTQPGGMVGSLNKLVQKLPVLPVIGNGKQLFYPCHVSDLAKFIEVLIDSPRTDQPVIAASEQAVTFRQILTVLTQVNAKRNLLVPVPYALIYPLLKCMEYVGMNKGLRSDSLKYLRAKSNEIDFHVTRELGVNFRPFTKESFEAEK